MPCLFALVVLRAVLSIGHLVVTAALRRVPQVATPADARTHTNTLQFRHRDARVDLRARSSEPANKKKGRQLQRDGPGRPPAYFSACLWGHGQNWARRRRVLPCSAAAVAVCNGTMACHDMPAAHRLRTLHVVGSAVNCHSHKDDETTASSTPPCFLQSCPGPAAGMSNDRGRAGALVTHATAHSTTVQAHLSFSTALPGCRRCHSLPLGPCLAMPSSFQDRQVYSPQHTATTVHLHTNSVFRDPLPPTTTTYNGHRLQRAQHVDTKSPAMPGPAPDSPAASSALEIVALSRLLSARPRLVGLHDHLLRLSVFRYFFVISYHDRPHDHCMARSTTAHTFQQRPSSADSSDILAISSALPTSSAFISWAESPRRAIRLRCCPTWIPTEHANVLEPPTLSARFPSTTPVLVDVAADSQPTHTHHRFVFRLSSYTRL
ncbi:hypothetical protein M011DRAFT_462877 [Sporormia fimetaria CBS 119925]|uniref:Secreted protein n=1 Tax=Sporormia fimetaria CBS 119925 TaxID=1340428 RepID=A0A6A6UXU8_9PLEO|nr:hypothetical protein M011DRAFT_462877 [Sporormia fimetaria CBS 119925]